MINAISTACSSIAYEDICTFDTGCHCRQSSDNDDGCECRVSSGLLPSYQLWQLRRLICSLSFNAAELLVQAFISKHLDYCNSLLYGISDNLYRRLQGRSKCRSMPHHQHEKVRAHHARPAAATLASRPPTCWIQELYWCTRHCTTSCPVSYTHLTLPTKRIV